MQQQKWTHLDFSRRTDALAARLGRDLGALPSLLGFSRASLFGYRSGKAKITPKAWSRLAQAETDAGIQTPLMEKLTAVNSEDEGEALRKVLQSKDWGDDDEAQLAALMGPELLGMSVKNGWDLLEASLRLFLTEARKADDINSFLNSKTPTLKNQLKGFRFQLDRYIDHVSRASDNEIS